MSVPAFYQGQNCQGAPDHYVTRERADEMKSAGEARACNRNRAIMILGPRPEGRADTHRDSQKTRWAIVGQTKKPFTDKHLTSSRKTVFPGFPRYALV